MIQLTDEEIRRAIRDEFARETTSLLAHEEDFQFKRAIANAQLKKGNQWWAERLSVWQDKEFQSYLKALLEEMK